MTTIAHARRASTTRQIEQTGVVAVIRLRDPGKVRAVVDALLAGGVRVLEVTMTVPGAIELIGDLVRRLPPELTLGAGTVVDAETAERVIGAGAQFLVSPVLRLPVIEVANRRDVAVT